MKFSTCVLLPLGLAIMQAQSTNPDPRYLGPKAPDPKSIGYDASNNKKAKPVSNHNPQLTVREEPHPVMPPKPVATVSIVDPEIPGIAILKPGSPGFGAAKYSKSLDDNGFIIENTGSAAIIGIAITYVHGSGRPYTTTLDGVSNAIHVAKGDTIAVGPFYLRPSNSENGVSAESMDDTPPVKAFVAFMVFEDGAFYGSDKWAAELGDKANMRRQIFNAALATKKPIAELFSDIEACSKDKACAEDGKITAQQWQYKLEAIDDYRAVTQVFKRAPIDLALFHADMLKRFPKLRTVSHLKTDLKPDSLSDGWYVTNYYATCFNGKLGYTGTMTNGCTYPPNSAGTPPPGALNSASQDGFWAKLGAECYQQTTGGQIAPNNYLHDGFSTLKLVPGGDPDAPRYLPRQNIYTNFSANYGAYQQGFDSTYSNYLVGIIEGHAPSANSDGGQTGCYVSWQQKNAPFAVIAVDAVYGLGVDGSAPLYSTNGNINTPWANPYGYVLNNHKLIQFCNPASSPLISAYAGAALRAVSTPNVKEYVYCSHVEPAGQAATDCSSTEWCCCMAAYNNITYCLSQGLTPLDYCPTQAIAANFEYSHGKTVHPIGQNVAGHTPDQIGAFTYVSYANGGEFLLDGGTYTVDQNTVALENFQPPSGVLAGDIPVSGDWTGSGRTRIGIYRPSTGQWFLDANGNGIWDGGTGGDYLYGFGGVQPSGTPGNSNYVPGDVPVVGDWTGGGKSCIGVFRYGYYWVLDTDCNGSYSGNDTAFAFGGEPGDIPVVGNWAGYGNTTSQVGVVRCYIPNGQSQCSGWPYYWVLDWGVAGSTGQQNHGVGQGLQCPYTNPQYWAQCMTPGPFGFGGLTGDIFVTGDWLGTGIKQAGVYRQGEWVQDAVGSQMNLPAYWFGYSNSVPIVGRW